jgi:hypothetical protein
MYTIGVKRVYFERSVQIVINDTLSCIDDRLSVYLYHTLIQNNITSEDRAMYLCRQIRATPRGVVREDIDG